MKKIRFWLYQLGCYLRDRFAYPPPPSDAGNQRVAAPDDRDIEGAAARQAELIADLVLTGLRLKLTEALVPRGDAPVGDASPIPLALLPEPPSPPPLETLDAAVIRIVREIHADVPHASVGSVLDRSLKAVFRQFPSSTWGSVGPLVVAEMKRQGIG